jgi:NAD(P)-dependent dehydrogenase (short-subunit alcohol dehydrogenase family)
MKLDNAVALVTGANRGIGLALVDALSRRGVAKIYAAARNVTTIKGNGHGASADTRAHIIPLQLDVTSPQQAAAAAKQATDVTLLINNAGIADFGSVLDIPEETLRRDLETNYFGTLGLVRAFASVIERNGGGAIANVLSIVSLVTIPRLGAYTASKAAAWSMTQSIRADLAARGISVHGVFPGPVDTDMAREFTMDKASPASVAEAILEGIATGDEDIFPDAMSLETYGNWRQDHKAVERAFASA